MNKKTLLIVGAVVAAAWLFMSRRNAAAPTSNSAAGANRNAALIGAGIGAASKVVSGLFGGSSAPRTGGTGTPTYVTDWSQISDNKVVGNGFVTSLDA